MRLFLSLIIWIFFIVWSAAQEPLLLNEAEYDITNYLSCSVVNDLSFDEANLANFRDADLQSTQELMIGENDIVIARIEVFNSSYTPNWTVEVDKNKLSHFKVAYPDLETDQYRVKNSGLFEPTKSQDGYFPNQKAINCIDIQLKPKEASTIYFYLENQRKFAKPNLEIKLIPHTSEYFNRLNDWKSRYYLIAGIFGFLIVLGFFFFYQSRDQSFLYYSLYLLSLFIWISYQAGLFFKFLSINIWPNNPQYSTFIGTVVVCYIFYISFIWQFGKLNDVIKSGRKILKYWRLYILLFIPILISWMFYTNGNIQLFFQLGLVFNSGMILFTILSLLLLVNVKKTLDISYSIIGLGLMLILLLIACYEIISNDFTIPKFSIISVIFIIEIVFFLFALAQRYKNYLQVEAENAIITKSLEEKDTLLKEIHHRVKNNLQVISALLTLQSSHLKDAQAKIALREGQDRVQSMALIHKDLYQHDNLKGVNAKEYLSQLVENLVTSYKLQNNIEVEMQVEEILFDVDTMIPLGLMINELISNTLKHAFADDQSGKMKIFLKELNDILHLQISDNGKGVTEKELSSNKSFGYSLIKSFARKLDADYTISSENGFQIDLAIKKYSKK